MHSFAYYVTIALDLVIIVMLVRNSVSVTVTREA